MIGETRPEVEKLFGIGSRKSRWQGVDYMTLVPETRLTWQEDESQDQVLVLVPRFRDPVLGRVVQPRLGPAKRHIRVPLERRGTFLWRLLDGRRTVADLARAYETEFPQDREQAPERVAKYLHAMFENDFIIYINLES
jgi:hypothetical protein